MIIHDCLQGTDEWHQLRAGIPTASEFSRLVTSSGAVSDGLKDYALELAGQKYAGKVIDGFKGNKYTERGHELEPQARLDYEMENQVETVQIGFVTNNLMQYGCSPDDLVGKQGSVEYKCKTGKEHIRALRYINRTGQPPTEYVAQPQGVMFVTGRKWCDLVFYHPDLPGKTIRIYPDKLFVKTLKAQLKKLEIEVNLIVEELNQM